MNSYYDSIMYNNKKSICIIIITIKDPFYEVNECFHKSLNGQLATELDGSLQHISIGSLLNILNIFIKTQIQNMPKDKADER